MSKIISPVYFLNDNIYESEDVGSLMTNPISEYNNYFKDSTNSFLKADYVINNITDICNTFMIRLLEDNINPSEIAYIIDFTDKFDMKAYLSSTVKQYILQDSVINQEYTIKLYHIIYSSIVFILYQFVQFYTMTKLVYSNEGVDLYSHLYKFTYEEECKNDAPLQTKYVFCVSILSSILEGENSILQQLSKKIGDNIITIS